jgi:hypothetical protein
MATIVDTRCKVKYVFTQYGCRDLRKIKKGAIVIICQPRFNMPPKFIKGALGEPNNIPTLHSLADPIVVLLGYGGGSRD